MKKDEIKKALNCFREAVANDKINIMLLNQNNHRKKRYKGLILKTKLEDIENVVKDSFDFLMEELDRRTLDIHTSVGENQQKHVLKNLRYRSAFHFIGIGSFQG